MACRKDNPLTDYLNPVQEGDVIKPHADVQIDCEEQVVNIWYTLYMATQGCRENTDLLPACRAPLKMP